MDKNDVAKKVSAIISRQLEVPSDLVEPKSSIERDLNADSIARVELLLELEETFEVSIPDRDSERIETVQDAIDCISSRVA